MFRKIFAQAPKRFLRPIAVSSLGFAAYSFHSQLKTFKLLNIDPIRVQEIIEKENKDFQQMQSELKAMKILVSKEEIAKAPEKMAQQIAEQIGKNEPLLVLTMLHGGTYFATDLKRALYRNGIHFKEDVIRITRYGHQTKGGEPRVEILPSQEKLIRRKILIIDDLIEGGVTLEHARRELIKMGVNKDDIYIAVLFDKNGQRLKGYENVKPHFVGFNLTGEDAKKWLVGQGCDQRGFARAEEDMLYFPDEAQKSFGYR